MDVSKLPDIKPFVLFTDEDAICPFEQMEFLEEIRQDMIKGGLSEQEADARIKKFEKELA